ncbi:hypothetical protein SAMN03159341_1434 [Paenibacillus sp. 1_12]|uniref:hypothetical protein n=1 Tax=Paenibacillus sp. 1_12 TaxID=1566278 RepID=UPI0008E24EFB|nr:hypothetical protein [Paenibacillus sp. 1_12]SFM52704.1 hypothetical protein SAMN03159341_1434 [Paenibacillus sp. 1_12]
MVLKKNIPISDNSSTSIKDIQKRIKSLEKEKQKQSSGEKTYTMSDQNKALRKLGKEIIKEMPRVDYEKLSSKSGTLHFARLLGLDSKRTTRTKYENGERVYNSGNIGSPKPIGVTLCSDEDITVPVIDVTINKDTGISIEEELSYKEEKAGVEFHLTLYEFMFLMLKDEYAGYLRLGEDNYGVHMELKTTKFIDVDKDGNIELKFIEDENGSKRVLLPTPTIKFSKGSVRAGTVGIDELGLDGLWRIRQGYEKFTDLVINKKNVLRKIKSGKAQTEKVDSKENA